MTTTLKRVALPEDAHFQDLTRYAVEVDGEVVGFVVGVQGDGSSTAEPSDRPVVWRAEAGGYDFHTETRRAAVTHITTTTQEAS